MTTRPHSPPRRAIMVRWTSLLAITVFAVACASSEKTGKGAESTAVTAATSTTAAIAPEGTPACPLEGEWTSCAVEDRLTHSGVVFEKLPAPVSYPFFTVPGIAYQIGNPEHEVQIFLYPSAAERERDTSVLDSASASPKGARHPWRTPPTLVTSNNMAAVILSLNDRTVERLALALGAGLPEAEKR